MARQEQRAADVRARLKNKYLARVRSIFGSASAENIRKAYRQGAILKKQFLAIRVVRDTE